MSSKGYLAVWAGALLAIMAGCDAGQQQQDPGSPATQQDQSSDNMAMYEPDDSAGSQSGTTDQSMDDPSLTSEDPLMGSDRSTQSQSGQSQMGMSGGQSLESMSPDQISGKTVVSAEGEEIGEVQEVVQDPSTSEKFAVVDVGGFLGVGQKSVAIPLSELQTSASGQDQLESNLTRQTLETQTEYQPGQYEPVQSSGQQSTR